MEYLEPIPTKNDKYTNKRAYLERENICDLVDNNNIKQIWVWMYHSDNTIPVESNMAMGTSIRNYWNNENYGDISNSHRSNDLPICKNTYTVFEYNYGRELGLLLENHGHHIEALLNYIDGRRERENWTELLFWGRFVGSDRTHEIINPGCGWIHYTPNSEADYEWYNEKEVLSDCEDWKPDGSGKKTLVNCKTWEDAFIYPDRYNVGGLCYIDEGVGFKVWWMQNIPGLDNGLRYENKELRNWWEFIGDFDTAIKKGKNLVAE